MTPAKPHKTAQTPTKLVIQNVSRETFQMPACVKSSTLQQIGNILKRDIMDFYTLMRMAILHIAPSKIIVFVQKYLYF